LKIEFEGRSWLLEMDEVGVKQGEKIAKYTGGLTVMGWWKSIIEVEEPGWLKSMQCLYWLIHEQNREPVDMDSDFAPLKLLAAFNKACGEEQASTEKSAAEGEEDPTKPAGGNAADSPARSQPPGSLPG
jgi:hypothetical protein